MTRRIVVDNVTKEYRAPSRSVARSLWHALRHAGQGAGETELIRALDGVSLTIDDGERVGIIGANGAGKSTLLHLITGVAQPSFGKVDVTGRVNAILTLGTALREEATGRENIYLDAELQGLSQAEIEPLVDSILEFAELGEFIDMPVRTYSSGMRARLAFSMVAFVDPEILILDEILSVGDVRFSLKATQRMKEIARAGKIVLFVSHAMSRIVELCTRCIWLHHGRVVMDGDPHHVTDAYRAAVKAEDQRALQRKFGEMTAATSGPEAARLKEFSIVQEGTGTALVLITGRDTEFRIGGRADGLQVPDLLFRILRVDGALIFEELFSARRDPRLLSPRFNLSVSLRTLPLNASLYRAEAELLDRNQVIARRALVFEVQTDTPQIGGVPMLVYPSRLFSRQLAPAAKA
jgi:homopolymeric O-antigen transport system ATP-binding protein